MSTVDNVAAGKPKIGGALYAAPNGTELPADATSSLNAAFKCLGYISEDGLTNAMEIDTEVVKAWGGDPVLVVNNGKDDSFSYTLIEVLNVDVLKHVYGEKNVSGTLEGGITIKVNNADTEDMALVVELILRGALKRIVIPCGHVSEVGEIAYKDNEAIGYETTVTCKPDDKGNTHYEYIVSADANRKG